MLSIRHARISDIPEIEAMVFDFAKGHSAEGPSRLYERVAIGNAGRDCYLSGKAYQAFAELDGLATREIIRLPDKELGLQPPDS